MDTSVIWADDVFDKKFNGYYPVFISTPNGETVDKVSITNMYVNAYDRDADPIFKTPNNDHDIPCVIIKNFVNTDAINWRKITTNLTLKDDDGVDFMVNVLDVVNTMTVNDTHRIFSSFVLCTKWAQRKAIGLNK